MAKSKRKSPKINTIEGIAGLIAEFREDMDFRFDAVEERFDKIDADLVIIRRILDRVDTRVAALELAVFGASVSEGRRLASDSLLERVNRLEQAILHK